MRLTSTRFVFLAALYAFNSGCPEGAGFAPDDPNAQAAGANPAPGTSPQDPSAVSRLLASASSEGLPPDRAGWPTGAPQVAFVGRVIGHVFDADSGQPLTGSVQTAADCAGTGCGKAQSNGRIYTTRAISGGIFTFSASATEPAQLTLTGDSAFTISASGYASVMLAHGPWGTLGSGADAETNLWPIFLCKANAADNDRDGICDAAEARYGSNPTEPDSDEDSLSDWAEIYGEPVSEGYALDIRGLGANPMRVDVLLEIDYMPNRKPASGAVEQVIAAFDNSPLNRESNTLVPGVSLLAWVDEQVPYTERIDAPDLKIAEDLGKTYRKLRAGNLPVHYCVFGDKLNYEGKPVGASGWSKTIAGTLFVVTLGSDAGDVRGDAGTLMHELGHNLGLRHGGDDHSNYKPHYFSVMNYMYQFPMKGQDGSQLLTFLDYSRFGLGELDEGALDEMAGVSFSPTLDASTQAGTNRYDDVTPFENPVRCNVWDNEIDDCGEFVVMPGTMPGEVDFNVDGHTRGVISVDLNADGMFTVLPRSINDWASLVFNGVDNEPPVRFVDDIHLCPSPRNVVAVRVATVDPTTEAMPAGQEVAVPPASGSAGELPELPDTQGDSSPDGEQDDEGLPQGDGGLPQGEEQQDDEGQAQGQSEQGEQQQDEGGQQSGESQGDQQEGDQQGEPGGREVPGTGAGQCDSEDPPDDCPGEAYGSVEHGGRPPRSFPRAPQVGLRQVQQELEKCKLAC